ncbi:MAG: signal peptidase I [Planctomycetaceae bacterium]|nr:signal peptidase I [Planctomycetaceae bacterium]
MTSVITFGAYLALLVVAAVVWILFLRIGLRWAKVADVTLRKLVLAFFLVTLFEIALRVGVLLAVPRDRVQSWILVAPLLGATIVVPCVIISWVFKARLVRSLQAWLPTLMTSAVSWIGVWAITGVLAKAFVISSASMAPTLLGRHPRGICPECGATCYSSASALESGGDETPVDTICEAFHLHKLDEMPDAWGAADRLLAAKYLKPRRWDLIVFRFPEDPDTPYVMRVIGLPGDEIVIENGAAYANGERLPLPAEIGNIKYVTFADDPWVRDRVWGTRARPARLGPQDYFVLGDFSPRSRDSRLWETGAPGHPPYAVPAENIVGVVTHIYWPPNRWRVLR